MTVGEIYTLNRSGNVHHNHRVKVLKDYMPVVIVHCVKPGCTRGTFGVDPGDLIPDEPEPDDPPRYAQSDRVRITKAGPVPAVKVGDLGTIYRLSPDPDRDRYLVHLDDGSKAWMDSDHLTPAADLVPGDRVIITEPHYDSDRGEIVSDEHAPRYLVRRDSTGTLHGYPGYMLALEPHYFEIGDFVIVTADDGTEHPAEILTTDLDPAHSLTYFVRYRDGDREWVEPESMRPQPKGRVVVAVTIPLTDPDDQPETVTELIDFIAENHEHVLFSIRSADE